MAENWFDSSFEDESCFEDNAENAFYCPYTNSERCAVLMKGWQPQELCRDLECEQLKMIKRSKNRHTEAA